jgi:hypothetical protein
MENIKRLLRKLIQFELEAINNISIVLEKVHEEKDIDPEIVNKLICAMEAHKIQCGNISNILNDLECPEQEDDEEPEENDEEPESGNPEFGPEMSPDFRIGNNYGDIEKGVNWDPPKYSETRQPSSFEEIEKKLNKQIDKSLKGHSSSKHI